MTADRGSHVRISVLRQAHVVVDCMVDMPIISKLIPDATPGRKLDTASAAEVYWQLFLQDKRCMSFEADVRPFEAQW